MSLQPGIARAVHLSHPSHAEGREDFIRTEFGPGGDVVKINLDDAPVVAPEPEEFILALHEALQELAKLVPRQAKVVELRYFGGLSEEEVAEVLETSSRTVRRDWRFAKAWLASELSRSG